MKLKNAIKKLKKNHIGMSFNKQVGFIDDRSYKVKQPDTIIMDNWTPDQLRAIADFMEAEDTVIEVEEGLGKTKNHKKRESRGLKTTCSMCGRDSVGDCC